MSPSNSTNSLIDLSQNLAEIVKTVGKSVVAINGKHFFCSGVCWREGIIVTSDESVKRPDKVTVSYSDKENVPVTLLGRDRSTDIAVFKTEAKIPTAPIDSNYELEVGQLAIAVGRDKKRGLFASQGIVNTVGGSWLSSLGGQIDRFIRLDLNFYPGSGGSALANAAGQVMGFNTTGPRRSVLTIPALTVNRVVDLLLETGHLRRGYLGLAMQPVYLPDSLLDGSLANQQGLMVVSIEPDSPAQQAGIFLGDILIKIEDTSIAKLRDIQVYLEPRNVGKTINLELIRAGNLQNLSLTVGEIGD